MKRDLPKYVYRTKGVLYFAKRPRGGKPEWIKLETQFPEGADVPFALHQEVQRLLTEPVPVPTGRDFSAVIRHYMATRFQELKPRTRKDYRQHLEFFIEALGPNDPRHVERRHVIAWRDKWAKATTPHRANYRLRVLRIILEHAIDMGVLPTNGNPAKGVSELKYEKTDREPWPQEKIDAFRKTATGRALLAFELCLGTGQRIGDVLAMKWGDVEGDGINVVQGKTGKKLWVPFTRALRAALSATDKRSVFILTNHDATGPWSYRGASQAIRKVRESVGALDYDIHGLRYSAASELFLAGADIETIAAVTGQSAAMVRHYTRKVRQKAGALRAKEIRE